jgi:hypothetical protein
VLKNSATALSFPARRTFRTIMVSDANAAMSQEEHDASLTSDVMDTDMVIASLRRAGSARAA